MKNPSFHEATLSEVIQQGRNIDLYIEDALYEDKTVNVILKIIGVRIIIIDNNEASYISMSADDAEILSLQNTDRKLDLILIWNDFDRGRNWTEHIEIVFDKISFHSTGGGESAA